MDCSTSNSGFVYLVLVQGRHSLINDFGDLKFCSSTHLRQRLMIVTEDPF